MKNRFLSLSLVVVQFSCIAFYIIDGPIFASQWYLLLLQLAAFAIAFWGILAMGILKVSVFPVPRENSELITSGPYRFIRHPMYTGIILMAGALIAARFTWLRLIVFLILVVNQIIKLLWEERMLAVKISSYKTYMERTWRLIPWIF